MRSLLIVCLLAFLFIMSFQPANAESIVAGPLELTPVNATLVMKPSKANANPYVMLFPTVKFSVKNISSSDVRVILIGSKLEAYDDLNQQLFPEVRKLSASGISLSSDPYNQDNQVFIKDKANFVSVSPGQQLQVFISINKRWDRSVVSVDDPSGEFLSTHRPTSMILNGALGIINVDGGTDVRAFSFSGIPVSVSVR